MPLADGSSADGETLLSEESPSMPSGQTPGGALAVTTANQVASAAEEIEVADPVTVSGLLADLMIHAPPRAGRSWTRYVLGMVLTALTSSGFHMVAAYRFGALFRRWRLLPLSFLVEKFIFHWYYCVIPTSARIGPGLWVPHPLGIVLNSRARLGAGVYLRQHAEIVHIWEEDHDKSGVVGDRAQLNSGCILVRGGMVGHDSVVAARAVVTKLVPPRHIAKGMPAVATPMSAEQLEKLIDRTPRWH